MQDDEAILATIDEAFAHVPAPKEFCPCTHDCCAECAELEAFWSSVDRTELSFDDLERAGWDSVITMLRSDGFRWFFPDFARLALQPDGGWFADELLSFHLVYQVDPDDRPLSVQTMTDAELDAVERFVDHLSATASERGIDDLLGQVAAAPESWRFARAARDRAQGSRRDR